MAEADKQIPQFERRSIVRESPICQRRDSLIDASQHPPDVRPIENPLIIVWEVVGDAGQIPCSISQDNNFIRVPVSAVLQESCHFLIQPLGARHGGSPHSWLLTGLAHSSNDDCDRRWPVPGFCAIFLARTLAIATCATDITDVNAELRNRFFRLAPPTHRPCVLYRFSNGHGVVADGYMIVAT